MATELDPIPTNSETKQYTDEEIGKILNTAKATRTERDDAAKKARDLETQVNELSEKLEKIKGIDPVKYKELEITAAQYEDRKLEEQRGFAELKERWTGEKTTLQQQILQLQESNRQSQIVNALEKSFYATGGKSGKDDDGWTYFDLIRDRAATHIVLDDQGKITIIDPRDKTPLKDTKGVSFTVDDLMFKLRSAGPTASLFEPISNGAGGGMTRSQGSQNGAMVAAQIMQIPSRSDRITKFRAMGIT
ncbi:MAG: hypothetical protein HWQ38_37880 [Nostoc sp. NMS7]|uniref:hypothetical protein n=1 Tax=Nostoc sp. NMS7 TaxID=2815391 RepID=UPI0025DFCA3B|nr:hypothetical protein [Nostoc sp. NMS7]MBN3951928.1 hypothetical protein [Nostoc sp. NMS7]